MIMDYLDDTENKKSEGHCNDIFTELQSFAYDVTHHKYYFKEANQIIRKHLEDKTKLKEFQEYVDWCIEVKERPVKYSDWLDIISKEEENNKL